MAIPGPRGPPRLSQRAPQLDQELPPPAVHRSAHARPSAAADADRHATDRDSPRRRHRGGERPGRPAPDGDLADAGRPGLGRPTLPSDREPQCLGDDRRLLRGLRGGHGDGPPSGAVQRRRSFLAATSGPTSGRSTSRSRPPVRWASMTTCLEWWPTTRRRCRCGWRRPMPTCSATAPAHTSSVEPPGSRPRCMR